MFVVDPEKHKLVFDLLGNVHVSVIEPHWLKEQRWFRYPALSPFRDILKDMRSRGDI